MDHYTQPDWFEETPSTQASVLPPTPVAGDDDDLDILDTTDQSPLRGRVIMLLSILSVVAVTTFGVQSVLGIFGTPDFSFRKSDDLNSQSTIQHVTPTPVRSEAATVSTDDWTKYRNTIYGVGLKYPSMAQTNYSYEAEGFVMTIFLPNVSLEVMLASSAAQLARAYDDTLPTNVLLTKHASWNTYLERDRRVATATLGNTPVIVSSDTGTAWNSTAIALIGTIEPVPREEAMISAVPELYRELDWREGSYEDFANLYVGAEVGVYNSYLLPMTSYEAQVLNATRDIYTSFHDYYQQSLEEQTWAYQILVNGMRYTAPDSAGPMGEQIGWVHVSDGSVRVVVVEYWLCEDVQDTCVTYELHVSDVVPLTELEQYRVE